MLAEDAALGTSPVAVMPVLFYIVSETERRGSAFPDASTTCGTLSLRVSTRYRTCSYAWHSRHIL